MKLPWNDTVSYYLMDGTIFRMEATIQAAEPMNDVDEALERVVYAAVGITTSVLQRYAPGNELTFAQWRVLVIVGAGDNGIRVGEIAARIGASGSAASRLLRRMERHGLVTTERDEHDRRATIVRLGEVGRQLRAQIVRDRRELIRRLLDEHGRPLPLHLVAGLEAIAEAFSAYT